MEEYRGYKLNYYPKCDRYPTHDNRYQTFKARPYDDADYAWAACNGRTVNYYRNNRKIASKPVIPYDPEDYEEYREYIDELVDSVCMTLLEYNRDVEPRMIHN